MVVEVKHPYEAVLSELEGLYARLQQEWVVYGEGFRDAWKRARRDTLQSYGWTEAEFYAELDARRAGRLS